ncbi:MAG: DUF1697 domain-containing protein [Betaproteobacteria bacterium]|nr:DUF1697 domain-containing protein [Betaproteobacteria bacterium]
MNTYVALFRGINVGGNGSLPSLMSGRVIVPLGSGFSGE